METPLPPPVPGTLGGPSDGDASSGSSFDEDEAFSMFSDADDELSIAKEGLISELGGGTGLLSGAGDARKVRACAFAQITPCRPSPCLHGACAP
jgi:hypothetical protein